MVIRHLSAGNYICRECNRVKSARYFISETLCKKCAAKRRLIPTNNLVQIPFGPQITEAVLRRLRRKAEATVPRSFRDHIAPLVPPAVMAAATFCAYWLFFKAFSLGAYLLGLLGLVIMFSAVIGAALKEKLIAPRNRVVESTINRLAADRQAQIDAMRQFYSSPEWAVLRRRIVKSFQPVCNVCGRRIRKAFDLTVDHIRPRSKYPELGLDPLNLQILCRSCNSSKGAKPL